MVWITHEGWLQISSSTSCTNVAWRLTESTRLLLLLPGFDFGSNLSDSLIDVVFYILRDAENGLLARETVSADRAHQPGTHPALALLELLPEGGLSRG